MLTYEGWNYENKIDPHQSDSDGMKTFDGNQNILEFGNYLY